MKTIKSTQIVVETLEKRIIRVNRYQTHIAFCDVCEARVTYFSVSRAAALLALSETAIFRLAESSDLHSQETETGSLLICGSSLVHSRQNIYQEYRTQIKKEQDNEK
jgi:hypothetical protein